VVGFRGPSNIRPSDAALGSLRSLLYEGGGFGEKPAMGDIDLTFAGRTGSLNPTTRWLPLPVR